MGHLDGARTGTFSIVDDYYQNADDVNSLAITPDGRTLIVGGPRSIIGVWDLQTGQGLRQMAGHEERVWSLAVTADGQRVVSASFDGTLKVWNLATGTESHALSGHTRGVWAVALTPDGRRAVSGSDDVSLKIWDVERGVAWVRSTGTKAQ